jgi:hypothetical protein
MELLFMFIVIAIVGLCIAMSVSPGCIPRFMQEPSDLTQLLVDNITNKPEQWRVTNNYFYNNEKGYIFWIYCGRGQFSCKAGRHIGTEGYQKIDLSQPQLDYIYTAYEQWLAIFNEMNLKETMPHIPLRRGEYYD